MFSPIALDFGELHSIFIASIVAVYTTLSYNVQGMIKLAISTLVHIHPVYTSMTFPTFLEAGKNIHAAK